MQAVGGLDDLLSRLEPSAQSLLIASISDPAVVKRLQPAQGLVKGLSQLTDALDSLTALVTEQTDAVGTPS